MCSKKLFIVLTNEKQIRSILNQSSIKGDSQSVLRSLSTLMFINIILDGMGINVIRYEPHTLSSRPSFSYSFIHFYSCEVVSSSDMRKNEAYSFDHVRIHNGGCFETLNLLYVSCCKMFTCCDFLHEAKQKTETNSRECTVRTGNQL